MMESAKFELQRDNYALYLAQLNDKVPVATSKPIFNENGLLLFDSGKEISFDEAEVLIANKLDEPLETQITLSKLLTRDDLLKHFKAVFFSYPDIGVMHNRLKLANFFEKLILSLKLPPLIIQKLTVQHSEQHQNYTKSLITAWLAVTIGHQMGCNIREMAFLFIAAIIRDFGFLHLDPAIVFKKGKLTAEDWRTIQSHVLVSCKFCETLDLHDSITRAVAEHHERCDTSGYPYGYSGEKISDLGQVLGMADSIQAIRAGAFDRQGRSLGDIGPYIQLNHSTYSEKVCRSAAKVFDTVGLDKCTDLANADYNELIAEVKNRLNFFSIIFNKISEVLSSSVNQCDALGCRKITSVTQRIIDSVNISGVLSKELKNYYANLDHTDPEQRTKLIEMDALTSELNWQINDLVKDFTTYNGTDCKNHCAKVVTPIAYWLNAALDRMKSKK